MSGTERGGRSGSPEGTGSTLDHVILSVLDEQTVIGLDTLVGLLCGWSWSQVFHAIDRLARCGQIVLRLHRGEYTIFSTHYAA